MASATANTIIIRGTPQRDERPAGETITPGQLLEVDSSGDLLRHNTANGKSFSMFAIENPFISDPTDRAIDHDYVITETTRFTIVNPGDQINAFLGAGENAAIGDPLESDGDGALDVGLFTSVGITAWALEAVNNAGTVPVRIRVQAA